MIWQPHHDAIIKLGVAAGLTTRQIAAKLGSDFTRNMVIGRHKRLRGIVHPSDEAKLKYSKAEREMRRAEHKDLVTDCLRDADRQIKIGLRRNFVIANTYRAGCTMREIADHLNLTRSRIQQICAAEGAA